MSGSNQSVDEFIMCLVGMGFELEDAQQAVQAGKLQVDQAIEWILAGKPKPQNELTSGGSASTGRLRLGIPSDSVGSNPFSDPSSSRPAPVPSPGPSQHPGSSQHPDPQPGDEALQSRYHMRDEQRELKERFEEKQRMEARKQAQEEKKAAKKAKEAVLKQIQEDREMAKLKRGGSNPNTSSTGGNTTGTESSPEKEPAASPTKQESALLQIRLPNGQALKQTFKPETQLGEVWSFAKGKYPNWMSHCLMQPFPRREFSESDMELTLGSLGLVPTGSLVMKKSEAPPAPPAQSPPAGEEAQGGEPMDVTPTLPVQESQPPDLSPPGPPPLGPPGGFPPPGAPGMLPAPPPPSAPHDWGSGNRLGQEGQEGDQPLPPEPVPVPIEDIEAESSGDEEEPGYGMPPGLGGPPGMGGPPGFGGPPGMPVWGPGQHGHQWGEGQALVGEVLDPEDNLPHHRRNPKELAAEAARKRYAQAPAVPMETEPSISAQPTVHIPRLTELCIHHISSRIGDTRHPITGMHGCPADVAILVLEHLLKEGLLRPKTLQPFVSCHLPRLVLNSYRYTTNELLAAIRYHRHLLHLGVASCPLINDNGLSSIAGLTRIKHLNVGSNPQLTNNVIPVLCAWTNLVTLVLEGTGVTDAGIVELANSTPQNLQNLDLSRTEITQHIIPALKVMPRLRTLNLEQTKIAGLSGIQGLVNLEVLNVANTQIVTDSLLCLRDNPSITALNLSHTPNVEGDLALQYISGMRLQYLQLPNRLTTTDVGLQYLSNMPLQQLDLTNYINVTDAGMEFIGRITSLRKLRLSNTKITDAGLVFLGGLKQLEELLLDRTTITDFGAHIIRDFSRLQELSLSETSITDELLSAKVLRGCNSLNKLNLSRTHITDRGIVHLSLPNLVFLNLDVTMVTEEKARSFPGCPKLVKVTAKNLQPRTQDDAEGL